MNDVMQGMYKLVQAGKRHSRIQDRIGQFASDFHEEKQKDDLQIVEAIAIVLADDPVPDEVNKLIRDLNTAISLRRANYNAMSDIEHWRDYTLRALSRYSTLDDIVKVVQIY